MSDAWTQLLAHPAWRGELAGYAGTAVLEEADDDTGTARFRLQGIRDGATATATVTARLTAGGPALDAEVHPGHGAELAPDALVAAVREALANGGIDGEPAARRPQARRALLVAGAAAALAAWALRGRR